MSLLNVNCVASQMPVCCRYRHTLSVFTQTDSVMRSEGGMIVSPCLSQHSLSLEASPVTACWSSAGCLVFNLSAVPAALSVSPSPTIVTVLELHLLETAHDDLIFIFFLNVAQ